MTTLKTHGLKRVAIIGSALPRRCGIATFGDDLANAFEEVLGPEGHVDIIAMDDVPEGYPYPERVKFQIDASVQADYLRAAEFINVNQYDAVVVQFEYGIFGGRDGAYLLRLLRALHMPIIATLHTALRNPSEGQRSVLMALSDLCEQLVVISEKAYEILREVYDIPEQKLRHIPHGIPDVPFSDPSFYKDVFDLQTNKVILTFGLLGPNKGIETMIDAMPEIVRAEPEAVYVVLGATHPHIKRQIGERYRQNLYQRVRQLGLSDHVFFHDRFVNAEDLVQYLGCADAYVTPYPSPEQISSGTLAYAVGAGKAVVSTPYWYAEELLAERRGALVPFDEPSALAEQVAFLLKNDLERNAMRKRAYQWARHMIWRKVGQEYLDLAAELLSERTLHPRPRRSLARGRQVDEELPELNLAHIRAMTDDTGILRRAVYSVPERDSGYSLDDNARAMVAVCRYYAHTRDDRVSDLIQRYMSFIFHALDPETKQFRNLLAYDRRWLEDEEEDVDETAHARALWALGTAVKYLPRDAQRAACVRFFLEALPAAESFSKPRAVAFVILGIQDFLEVYKGDSEARRMRAVLANELHAGFKDADGDWLWHDDVVTQGSGRICEALILAGQWIPDHEMHQTGLKALRWLLDLQTAPGGHLSLLGSEGWVERDGTRARFPQLPTEAANLADACATAYRVTRDRYWADQVQRAYRWFLDGNDLGVPMVDFATGGCADRLGADGADAHQTATATLAWLNSLLTMYELMGHEEEAKAADLARSKPASSGEAPVETATEGVDQPAPSA